MQDRYLPYVVFGAIALFSSFAALTLHRSSRARELSRFEAQADDVARSISNRITHYVDALRAGEGLFNAVGEVSQAQFKAFADTIRLPERYPGIQGYGYTRQVSRQPTRHAIVYLEPQDRRNRVAVGYDMYSEPVRRRAMEAARDTAEPVASGRVRLVQEIDQDAVQQGFLIYTPVYRTPKAPATVDERRAALRGFVYAPFRAGDLLAGVLTRRGLSLTVWDEEDAAGGTPLYAVDGGGGEPGGLVAHRSISVAGRTWRLRVGSRRLLTPAERAQPLVVFAVGLAAAWAFFLLLRAAGRRSDQLRRAQEELREAARTLEARVQQRTTELAAANQELEAFAYSVSHDLRAPLRSISSFSALVERAARERLTQQERDDLGRVRLAVTRMQSLIDALFELSRVANQPPARAELDLTALTREIAESMSRRFPHPVDLRVAEGLRATGDEGMVRSLLDNLLSNAWKYTSRAPEAKVEVGLERGAFFVRDNGVGIPADGMKDLFRPFKRLHPDFQGSGIGLATVRRVVTRHGGRVWVESEEGRGTTVFFTLSEEAA